MTRIIGHRCISVGDTEVVAIDYTDFLDSTELLSGTPTAVEVDTTDLTIASVGRNGSALVILGQTVAIDKAVLFQVSGGTAANSPYRIKVSCGTDGTPARTIVREIKLSFE